MKQINKVAVLGAGVMGATIAAHLANAGIQVLLLDIVPREPNDAEKGAGLTLESRIVRNRIAQSGLDGLLKMKPAPFLIPAYASYITVGNFTDDMAQIKECDWVVEVVLENMEIKKKLFTEMVVPNLKEGAILSTNTSGLSVNGLAQCLPESVRKNFLVTHFFNPPRYMRLMEMVACSDTDPAIVDLMANFLSVRLGKGIVYGKDTPNFIANRIGVYAGANAGKHMVDMGLTVEEVDAISGTAMARPKTATFALWDLVGIDTAVRIGANTYDILVNDDEREMFKVADFMAKMVEAGITGKKVKKGFYKREKVEGKDVKFFYDYLSGDYKPTQSPKFASVLATKQLDDPGQRLKTLVNGSDNAAEFAWKTLRDTLIYTAKRIPEIADDVVNIDNAMKWGYNWELGPFEMIDALGVADFVARAEKDGLTVPAYLKTVESFYKIEDGRSYYFSILDNAYREVPRAETAISLSILKRNNKVVEKNNGASLIDLGDGVFGLEFHTKMNAIGSEILTMIHKGIKRTEEEGAGLVIANEGQMFSAGANLMMLVMAIAEGAFDEINLSVKAFQKAMMAIKYSKIPVVAAPHNLVMGGGCETCLHADAMVPHAETYMGLVEIGVGLLPGGGGTKEMALRAIKLAEENDADVTPFIIKNFQNIAMAKVSMSAAELYGMGFMRHGDAITMNIDKRIHDAKLRAIALAANYRPSKPQSELKAPGRSVAASIKSQLWNMQQGGFISEYDQFLAGTIADVITGGDVPGGTLITEEYLLDLEREAFVRLCGQKKTLERVQHMLKKGKPLRN